MKRERRDWGEENKRGSGGMSNERNTKHRASPLAQFQRSSRRDKRNGEVRAKVQGREAADESAGIDRMMRARRVEQS